MHVLLLCALRVWAVVASHLHHVLLCIVKGPYAVTHVGSNRTTQRPHPIYTVPLAIFFVWLVARHGQKQQRWKTQRTYTPHRHTTRQNDRTKARNKTPPLRAAAAQGCRLAPREDFASLRLLVARGPGRIHVAPPRPETAANIRRHPIRHLSSSSPDLQRKHHAPLDEASGVGRTNMVVVLFSMMKGIENPPKTASGETGAIKDGKTQVVFAIGIDGTRIE